MAKYETMLITSAALDEELSWTVCTRSPKALCAA